jgi:predicted NBD/HSP70 family sugar kinase
MSDVTSGEESPIAAAVSAPVMRRHNLSLALRTIWDAGRISRAELSRTLNLSKPAITRIVGDLIGAGYLDETSERTASGRGRPSSYLHLRPGMHYFIGVDFRVDRMAVQARDLAGNILYDRHYPVRRGDAVSHVIAIVADAIAVASKQIGSRPMGIGVSVPAEMSPDQETILTSTYFDWRDVPFIALLRQTLGPGWPIIRLSHVSHCAAIANWRELAATGVADLAHVQVGVGAGLGLAGRHYPTNPVRAGFRHFGHMPMLRHGPACTCGRLGCLDALVGFDALVRNAEPCGIKAGEDAEAIKTFCTELSALHTAGRREATTAIETAAQWFARATAVIIMGLDPSRVTIGGYPLYLGEAYRDAFMAELEPIVPNAASLVTSTRLGDEASVAGAVLLGMQSVMADPLASTGQAA